MTNQKILIGCDFSLNKPAVSILYNNKYSFIGWPYNLQKKLPDIYKHAGVDIITRTDDKIKGEDASAQMRYQVKNALYLSQAITDTLKPYLGINTHLAFEGISYGSSGDVSVQLGGYKYIIMNELCNYMPLENIYTYAPTTVKKTGGCSKKGLGKHAMIESFTRTSEENTLRDAIRANRDLFMKKGGNNYIDGLDDFVDAYFVLKTLQLKENL